MLPSSDRTTLDLPLAVAEPCSQRLQELAVRIYLEEERRYHEIDLETQDIPTLQVLSGPRELTPQQVASSFGAPFGEIASELAVLERLDIVKRRRQGTHDRVSLTPKGLATLRAALKAREEIVAAHFRELPLADLHQLYALLERLVDDSRLTEATK